MGMLVFGYIRFTVVFFVGLFYFVVVVVVMRRFLLLYGRMTNTIMKFEKNRAFNVLNIFEVALQLENEKKKFYKKLLFKAKKKSL